jgi:hypothetical protein
MNGKYAIIDIEISNEMDRTNWDNKKAIPCLCGALLCENDKRLALIQLAHFKEMSKEDFADSIRIMLSSLQTAGYKLFALNSMFEQDAIEVFTGELFMFFEIRQNLKGSLSSKENLYHYLQIFKNLPIIVDVFEGNSKLCPYYYNKYIADAENNEFYLQQILSHNQNCLLKEFYILKHIDFIIETAEIDKNGFILNFKQKDEVK